MQIKRYSGGLLLAVALMTILPASASNKEDGDILTAPRIGDEYVIFRSGPSKARSVDEVDEENLNLGSNSALLGVLTGSILSPADTLPIIEVQTEVSVVTSKEVLVGGRPVAPLVEVALMSDTGRRPVNNAEEEERKILERKAKAGKKKAPATVVAPVPALVLGAAEGVGKAVEVVPEAIKGVQSPKFEPKEGEIGVPPQKAIEGTTPSPGAQPLTTVPPPPIPFRGDIVAVNLLTDQNVGSSSDGLFGVSSGNDKASLEPAASNQASRVNVKKGPNGEDYEYEYVYYYYDEDDKVKGDGKGAASSNKDTSPIFEDLDEDPVKDEDNETPPKAAPSTTSTTTTTTSTTTTTTTTTTEKPTTEAQRTRVRSRGGSATRSRFHVKNQQHHQEEESEESVEEDYSSETVPERGFGSGRQRGRGGSAEREGGGGSSSRERESGNSEGNRNRFRYTTIDRNRGATEEAEASVGNKIRGAAPAIEEAAPASNEVGGGSRGGPRYRSRSREQSAATVAVEPVPEERLPSNTRFPPRGRGRGEDSSAATEPISRTPAPTPSSPPLRGAVRPSLELVDSSSFRTNAGGASPDQDLAAPSFPAVPSGAPVRFLGVNAEGGEEEEEEEDPSAYLEDAGKVDSKKNKDRAEPVSTTPEPTPEISVDPTYSQDLDEETVSSTLPAAVEKSVLDLYAILQAQDNASNLVSTEEGDDSSSELSTTPQDSEETTTTPQPTTTTVPTTTTEPPTTTVTTTTTTAAPTTEKAPGRSRFRGRGNGSPQSSSQSGGRNRYRRPDSGATSTTTEAPSSEAPTKGRFTPSRSGAPGRGRGSYGRRSTTTASPASAGDEGGAEEEKPVSRPFSRPSLSRTPGNRFRGRAPAGATPSSTTESAASEGVAASSPSLLARPTFADRYNLRRRVGLSTTTAATPATEESEDVDGERSTSDAAEASPAPPAETSGRLPRPRVRPPGSLSPRPLRPGPRINLVGRARPGLAPLPVTSSTAAAEEQSDVVQDEAASETHSAAEEHEEGEDGEDKAAVTTPIPGPLTRLRTRPRLRVTEKVSTARPAAASSAGRRQLVSSLLPRRRPGQASTAAPSTAEEGSEGSENLEEAEEHKEDGADGEEEAAPTTPATSTTAHQEERGLAGLLAGRKRARRPGTLFSGRPAPQANGDAK